MRRKARGTGVAQGLWLLPSKEPCAWWSHALPSRDRVPPTRARRAHRIRSSLLGLAEVEPKNVVAGHGHEPHIQIIIPSPVEQTWPTLTIGASPHREDRRCDPRERQCRKPLFCFRFCASHIGVIALMRRPPALHSADLREDLSSRNCRHIAKEPIHGRAGTDL